MIGELKAVLGKCTAEGHQWVEIFESVGTILERPAGSLLLGQSAAIELARRVNRDADAG